MKLVFFFFLFERGSAIETKINNIAEKQLRLLKKFKVEGSATRHRFIGLDPLIYVNQNKYYFESEEMNLLFLYNTLCLGPRRGS